MTVIEDKEVGSRREHRVDLAAGHVASSRLVLKLQITLPCLEFRFLNHEHGDRRLKVGRPKRPGNFCASIEIDSSCMIVGGSHLDYARY